MGESGGNDSTRKGKGWVWGFSEFGTLTFDLCLDPEHLGLDTTSVYLKNPSPKKRSPG